MKFDLLALLLVLHFVCTVSGEEPAIVFDNRPETGVPSEALAQQTREYSRKGKETFFAMTDGTVKTVRIRYFNKETWATEEQARDYVRGFLKHKSLPVYGFQIWSQLVGVPEIECRVEFTKRFEEQLLNEVQPCGEGRLLIWNTEACFRDATGRWWFVTADKHFHASHPKGTRDRPPPTIQE